MRVVVARGRLLGGLPVRVAMVSIGACEVEVLESLVGVDGCVVGCGEWAFFGCGFW